MHDFVASSVLLSHFVLLGTVSKYALASANVTKLLAVALFSVALIVAAIAAKRRKAPPNGRAFALDQDQDWWPVSRGAVDEDLNHGDQIDVVGSSPVTSQLRKVGVGRVVSGGCST